MRDTSTEFPQKLYVGVNDSRVGVFDTLSDSIQYLNFAKKMIHSIFDSILLYPRFSSTFIIQFKEKSAGSIQKII